MADVLALIAQRRRLARIGTVTDIASGGAATVDINGGSVFAQLTDQTSTVEIGAQVAVLPVGDGDTWLVVASLSDGGASGSVVGSNLLANPGMEFGGLGAPPTNWSSFWTAGPASTTWDNTTGAPHSGTGVAQVTLTPTTDPTSTFLSSTPVALDDSVNYQCSAWVQASSATSNLEVDLEVLSAPLAAGAAPFGAGAIAVTLATVTLPGDAWQEISGVFMLPAGNRYASLFLHAAADAGADLTVWWDDAAITQVITS